MKTLSYSKQRRLVRYFVLSALILAVALMVNWADTRDQLEPKPVAAQGGEGDEPADKPNSHDFYPDPLSSGSLAFSLRDPWDHTDLTYFFHNCPTRLDCEEARQAVREGFMVWTTVSALTFEEVDSAADADIEVTWIGSEDPEGVLGTVGETLAYAYFPRYGGDMFIDDAEPWTIGDGGEFDLYVTATHEIGHGIGLGHSEFTTAIMYPYSGYASELGPDDINGIQELYGPPSGTTPPANNDDPVTDNPAGNIPENNNETVEVSGTVDNSVAYEVWDLTVDAPNTTVTITMTANNNNLDPYIGVLTEDLGTVLAENDDMTEGNRNAQIVYTFAEAGTYKIIATRYGFEDGTTSGDYTLVIEFAEGTGSNPDPGEGNSDENIPATITWRVTNYAGTELCYIYFSESTADTWGPDQIGEGQVLQDNFYLQWDISSGTYDIQVWDCLGNKLERYTIEGNRNLDIQIFAESIEVVPLDGDTTTDSPSAPENYVWRVVNYADTELCAVYFNPTTEPTWGTNQVTDPLQDNFYYEWDLARGTYDIRVEDCLGNFLELREVRLERDVEVQVYSDQILLLPLD